MPPDFDDSVLTDFELISIARAGDRSAFGKLIERHYRSCVNVATVVLRDRTAAQDEVQKAAWKAFAHLDQYQGAAAFSTWLLRIVENECLMLMRERRRAQFLYLDAEGSANGIGPLELPAAAADPEHDLINRQLAEMVQREVRCIPPLLRNVLVLRDIQQLPIARVALQLGISIPAAKSRLVRARRELRERAVRFCGPNGFRISASRVQVLPAKAVRRVMWAN
jgi:RNA polymerase sigma-70 factor (ECF subfamily)